MDGPLTGRRVAGYELGEVLGRGATATVYRARQVRLGRDVAVKVLDPTFGDQPEYVERFEREGRAAAALDHPSIVTIHEAGEIDGQLYLAMQLIEGTTLAERLGTDPGLDADQTAALLRPVAEALDHAHAAGVVHRDVKPSNIFLDDRGNVFLGDFGVAGLVHGVVRETIGAVGTADYMAPEQVDGAQAGPAADVYSLGCVLHECMTGEPPFPRPTLLATLRAQVDDEVAPTGDERLDAVLATALAKDPDARPERAEDLIDRLVGVTPTDPAATIPVDPADGGSAGGTRRLVAATLVAVAVVAAVVAVVLIRGGGDDDSPVVADPPAVETTPTSSAESSATPTTAAGPGGGDPADEPVTAPLRTTLEIGIDAALEQFDTLNPHIEPFNTQPLLGNVLPVLYELDEQLLPTPSLAASAPVVVSEDPLVIDYPLRTDAVWDDGTPITSADAVATYEYLVSLGDDLVGRQPYDSISAVTALDEATVRVEYATAHYSYFLFLSGNHPVLPAAALADHAALGGAPADFLADDIGFSGGPFSLTRADLGDGPGAGVELRLVANPAWWGAAPGLERITIRHYGGLTDAVSALGSSDVDALYLRRPTIGTADELAAVPGVTPRTESVGPSAIAVFTQADRLGAEPAVRQAVIAAIDRSALANAVLGPAVGGAVEPLDSLAWTPEHALAQAPFAGVGGDPDEARRILAGAGWTLVEGDPVDTWVRDGEELRLTLLIERAPPIGQLGASIPIQLFNDLEAAGIQLDVFAEDADVYAARASAGDHDLRIAFTPTQADPTANLVFFGGADRAFGYDGPAAALIQQAEATIDDDARLALVEQAEADLVESGFALPLFRTAALTVAPDDATVPASNGRFAGPLIDLPAWAFAP
ncbi:MAG: ABC transporter substrate-binding protein [Actinomycetota bacterium]